MTTADLTPTHTSDDSLLSDINHEIGEAYDKRVYTSNSFPYSSPGHLRAAAHLYGLGSVPLETARVLELGCAGGGNLLPFAIAYPNAQVVGVDLSSVQIEQGQSVVAALSIKNLSLHAMSLTDINKEFGQFDYIIAHGVFSWVPPEVREAMLRILRENLAPDGIGYISYNTYPGWKAGDIVRDAMLLHSHGITSDEERLGSAKAMLNLLSEGIARSNPLATSLRSAVNQLLKQSDYYIAHEYLEKFNSPCYLLEFVSMADQHGLTHVGDSDPNTEMSVTYGQNVQLHHSLVALGQPREMRQQYLDFAIGRNFRKSLIVHKERAGEVFTSPDLDRLADLRWAGHFTEGGGDKDAPQDRQAFRNHKNRPLYTNDDGVIAVLKAVSAVWPATLDFDSLVSNVRPDLLDDASADAATARAATLGALQTLFKLNMLRYTFEPSPYDRRSSESAHCGSTDTVVGRTEFVGASNANTPQLIPGALHLYQQRRDPTFGVGIFNLWHDAANLRLPETDAFLLSHINGQNNRKQLVVLLRDALHRGAVRDRDGTSLKGRRNLDAHAESIVRDVLSLLNRSALIW